MTLSAQQELNKEIASGYQEAGKEVKSKILDNIYKNSGYN
jgi:hypothetical protein